MRRSFTPPGTIPARRGKPQHPCLRAIFRHRVPCWIPDDPAALRANTRRMIDRPFFCLRSKKYIESKQPLINFSANLEFLITTGEATSLLINLCDKNSAENCAGPSCFVIFFLINLNKITKSADDRKHFTTQRVPQFRRKGSSSGGPSLT